ncbi:Zn(2)-C6 fungal-type DNA-binding protein domain containing protein [Sporothrix schenckii 1099-18]|uniref:Zn(2)-C6 fungal-type DNA-binding protein domain containing protein n=1 Tax=Sporothrix schenckii 1099-18 TaxID=1397361 RepID=A0A0F2M5Z2_SPOSC|nr:Zn(2)-C6 fungal-type DNA-binding protein domain containing protein [Sporothrix schenckii 1099-18]KJR83601.1 Zn(2)-C6 fungal-type DNA-binding protein domain containing protein [Sporothrix schenckii 1099-18]
MANTRSSSSTATTTATTRAASSRLKSLTFTGCWTCRTRKVKCDERETNGCGVCEGAGLACAGYEVRLCWVTTGRDASQREKSYQRPSQRLRQQKSQNHAPSLPGPRRRGLLHRHTGPVLSDDDIMKALTTLDTMDGATRTETIGPFAIFQADGFKGSLEGKEEERLQDTDNLPKTASATEDITTMLDAALPAIDLDADPGKTHIDPSECVNPSSPIDNVVDTSPHLGLSMPLLRDSQTAHLLYHFTNHVAELLQPVHHPGNPWRTTYFSFALEGCPELWLAQTTASPTSFASQSLFHSLLSAAAFHLRNATDGSVGYHRLALQHRIKALQALNAATLHPTNQQLYLIHLTAMLSLVTVDTMAGEDSDFPVHLKACYQLKKPAGFLDQELVDGGGSANSQIYSICRFLTLLARTTSPVIVARPWATDEEKEGGKNSSGEPATATFNVPNFRDSERAVEYMYGITPALGNMLAKTCQMAEHLAYYQQMAQACPGVRILRTLQQACAALGDELAAWTVDDEPFRLIEDDENEAGQHTMREIARCQARAFHGAVLLYYYRTLQTYGLHDRRAAPVSVDVHSQVQIIWAQLTTAEDLKDAYYARFHGGLKRTAPMSWPAFIAACEAAPADRPLWVVWWERVNGYRIGNFARQWQIIQDVWQLQELAGLQGHGRIGWREALARTGKLVLPI